MRWSQRPEVSDMSNVDYSVSGLAYLTFTPFDQTILITLANQSRRLYVVKFCLPLFTVIIPICVSASSCVLVVMNII